MTNVVEPLGSIPFGLWVDERAKALARDPTNWKNLSAGSAIEKPNGHAILADRLGVGESWLRKGAWRTRLTIERAIVEDALDHFDSTIDELYPELAVRGSTRTLVAWCDGCAEQTTPMADGTCPWCGGKTLGGDAPLAPCGCGCGASIRIFDKKGRPVKWKRGHAPRSLERKKPEVPAAPFAEFVRDVVMAEHPVMTGPNGAAAALGIHVSTLKRVLEDGDGHRAMVDPKMVQRALRKWGAQGRGKPWREGTPRYTKLYRSRVCPSCSGPKARAAKRCKTCSVAKPLKRKPRRRMRSNVKISAWMLGRARKMHVEEGMSLRAIARELLPSTTYASENSLLNALSTQMRLQGWTVRDQSTATAVANRERAFRPQCSHVFKLGPRKGQRCPKNASGEGSTTCWGHHPENIAAGVARLRSGKEARDAEDLAA